MNDNFFDDFEIINIDAGDNVVCDLCNGDFTNSNDIGGFIFESKAVCPVCAPQFLKNIKKYNEEKYIRAHCPEGQSFGDFVRSFR